MGPDPAFTLTDVIGAVTPPPVSSNVRAAVEVVGAVFVGGVTGCGLVELGLGEVRWGNTQHESLAAAVGALGLGLLAGAVLLRRGDPAFLVRVPAPTDSWPGARCGAAALVLAPAGAGR